jgi:hypothetical protein
MASSLDPKSAATGLVTDIPSLRADFPILHQEVYGKPLIYLDSAASSQRSQAVLDAILHHEQHDHANVHRGVHALSQRSTEAYEGARETIRAYINAASSAEIIFTRGTTESINLVAASLGQLQLNPGDEVLVTGMEHHSNLVPWQMICERTGARVVPAPITRTGELDRAEFTARLSKRTKIVALTHVSNALGTINPVQELIAEAHEAGALVLIDGALAAPHLKIDVQAEDISVVGIGDMSGDVFGNGMLMSEHIRLVAAFNHLRIFVDPDPDPKVSFKERQRLFESAGSTWGDYGSNLISKGGGVFMRAAKSIAITPQMKSVFQIDQDRMTPNELIVSLLKAPVDLLWNGGIGTYIKARHESDADVGDRHWRFIE